MADNVIMTIIKPPKNKWEQIVPKNSYLLMMPSLAEDYYLFSMDFHTLISETYNPYKWATVYMIKSTYLNTFKR